MDRETCSLCLTEVPFTNLREVVAANDHIYEGALVCSVCRADHSLKTRRV
jgi:thymidine kinase